MIGRASIASAALAACALLACQDGEIRLSSGADLLDATTVAPDAAQPDGSADDGSVASDAGSDAPAADVAQPDAAGCHGDPDCKLASLHCDLSSGQCVACTADSQCTKPGLPRCDLAEHRCVGCAVNGDCDGGVCDPATLTCVVPCNNGVCPLDDHTCDSHGYCSTCAGDAGGCQSGFCDDDNGQCGQCYLDSQCPSAKPHCDRTRDVCVQCLASSDCPSATPVCDPQTWTCVSP